MTSRDMLALHAPLTGMGLLPPTTCHAAGEGGSLAAQADATNAVEVFGLQKVFHAPRCKGCWCALPREGGQGRRARC